MMKTNKKDGVGIYVHIPFCIRKCSYCDFLSFEDFGCCEEYINALIEEIKERGGKYADTVFIGGGTPSSINPEYIVSIIENIRKNFIISEDAEITIEVNPGTVDESKLSMYKKAGINRLSIGVQSFDNGILKGLGRIHDSETAVRTVELARKTGFDNISVDLMFAVPGLDMKIWKDTLNRAVRLKPRHISFYSLQIEENTLFGKMYEEGSLCETSQEDDREMYHYAIDFLKENGYMQYEVSNAAIKGFESLHNMKYWDMADYLGIGLGASSFENGRRTVNTSDLGEYISGKRLEETYVNRPFDNASEFVFTGLRKTCGISLKAFKEYTGEDFFEVFADAKKLTEKWQEKGYIEFDGDILKLTVQGMDIQNIILKEFV